MRERQGDDGSRGGVTCFEGGERGHKPRSTGRQWKLKSQGSEFSLQSLQQALQPDFGPVELISGF